MPPEAKKILHNTVDGQESLRLSNRFESAHVPFSLSRVLMRNFGTIVRIAARVGGELLFKPRKQADLICLLAFTNARSDYHFSSRYRYRLPDCPARRCTLRHCGISSVETSTAHFKS